MRSIPGFEKFDEAIHCLKCTKPGTGTKDAPRAFSLKLKNVTKNHGLKETSFDKEFEIQDGLRTAKHVDDVNITGKEAVVGKYVKIVEQVFGECKVSKHNFTCIGVRHQKLENGDDSLDQDD